MANIKNLNNGERYKAHKFLSEYAEHVGEDKLYDDGRHAKFHKRKGFEKASLSELIISASKKKETAVEKEPALGRDQFSGYMRKKEIKDKFAPKDYR